MSNKLVRGTGLLGALVIGLGSILGTGAYVSIGLSADIAGDNLCFCHFDSCYYCPNERPFIRSVSRGTPCERRNL